MQRALIRLSLLCAPGLVRHESLGPIASMRGFSAHCPRGPLALQKEDCPRPWGEAGAGCRPENSLMPSGS